MFKQVEFIFFFLSIFRLFFIFFILFFFFFSGPAAREPRVENRQRERGVDLTADEKGAGHIDQPPLFSYVSAPSQCGDCGSDFLVDDDPQKKCKYSLKFTCFFSQKFVAKMKNTYTHIQFESKNCFSF